MHKKEKIIVGLDISGRLDVFLAGAVPEVSRSHWKGLVQNGRVAVNGKTITIKQAAAILDCHPLTVCRHAQRGNLDQIKLSPRCVRYDLEQVERLAAEGIQTDAGV